MSFETPDGYQRVDDGPTTSVSPVAEQRFSIGDIESDLYVGEAGNIHGTVTNEGPLNARNVVVKYAGESPNIVPLEDSVAVGTLEAGESGEFRLPIEVSSEAEAITRSANIVVQYRDEDFDAKTYRELELLFDVDPKRDRFDVAVTNRTIETGGTRTLSVDVTNNLNETVSDVEARMFADDPMSTGNTDTGYVQSIDPGETVTMQFDLAASGSATPGSTYPISFDFRFDDSDGDSQLSNTIRAPVDVTESTDDGFSLPFIGGLLLIALAAVGGVVWYRRQ
ncbi:exo-alpha-sialidase [Natronomonas gomsonensis]|nr:exo-alpha-sialidase [Natronomonas gomsonensis]